MRKLWLIFSQAVTISLAALFVIVTLRPDLVSWSASNGIVTIRESIEQPAVGPGAGSLSVAAKKAMPSVVNIFTSKEMKVPRHPFMDDPLFRRFFGDQLDRDTQQSSSLGSGVIVGPEGYILTNHHVIEAADEIELALADGRKAPARVVGTDPETDLAVLKVNLSGLPAVTFGQPDKLSVGDMVLGLASSGLHSNGYSLVRRIVERSGLRYDGNAPFSTGSLGKALLEPTRIYVKPLLAAIRATGTVKGLAHITGGGLPGNVPRCLPDGVRARLDARQWSAPPVFRWLRDMGQVPTDDMLRTFNCGLGMIVVVAPADAARAAKVLEDGGERVHEIGLIEAAPGSEADCVVDHAETLWRS